MKAWLLLPFVFLAGLVIGGLQPRGEIRRLRQDLDTRRKAETVAPARERQLASFLNMLPMDTPRRGESAPAATSGLARADSGSAATQVLANATSLVASADGSRPELTPEERRTQFQERLQQAAEAWRLRAEIARNTFASQTGYTQKEMTDFDVLMSAMNIRLQDLFKQTAEQLEQGGQFTPESGVRLMNGLTEAMVLTYDEMDRKLPANWRQDAGASFDLVTYVDPTVAQPLVEVADKLPKPGERRALGGARGPFRP